MAEDREIFARLVSESFYAYRDGDIVEFPPINDFKKASYGSIEEKFISQTLTRSDFFIAYAVMVCVVGNLENVLDFLKWYKRMYPLKMVPNSDSREVKSRLNALVKHGVLRSFVCQGRYSENKIPKALFYSITEKGAHALFRILDMESGTKYNCWATMNAPQKILRHLDGVNTAACFMKGRHLVEISCDTKLEDKIKRCQRDIVATLKLFNAEKSELVKVFIEPVHMTFDEKIKSVEEVKRDIRERIDCLVDKYTKIMEAEKRKYTDVKLVFVLDGVAAFKELSSYFGERYRELTGKILLTSDGLVRYANSLRDCFVKVGKEGLEPDDHWCFDEI